MSATEGCATTYINSNEEFVTVKATKFDFNLFSNGEAVSQQSTSDKSLYVYNIKTGGLKFTDGDMKGFGDDSLDGPLRYFKDTQGRSVVRWRTKDYDGSVSVKLCTRAGQPTVKSPSQQKQDAAAKEIARTFRTAPNQGVKLSQIETLGAIEERVSAGGNNMYNYEYQVHLFLKDGTVYKSLEVPPTDFDAATSRKSDAKNWSQWKRSGTQMLIKEGNIWKKFEGSLHGPVGKVALVGALESTTFSGSTALMRSSYSTTALTLKPGGQFETSYNSLSATGSAGLLPGNGSTRSSFSDQNGRISTSASVGDDGFTTVNAAGSSTQKNNASKFTGIYRVDGYTLELKYGDGTVSRDLFFPLGSDTYYKDNNWWELKK